ncbi:hypothetical protein FRX57_01415 [Streptococcus cuniculipharyngis]|uniref:Uncharacterized protein n=2 Tax=Streptococcus cuniculipharyngis TaxID=1562651 RepID=A0A5C5SEG9_9STRE|nr:hypothetical protein FRX57_01415 [Streptococcus cuniculipharyngis]
MQATGKSFSAVKRWRLKIEELSGYEFKKVRMRVSRRRVQDVFQFTDEEFEKFIRLSHRLDETKNMNQSVVEIWGDLKAREERQLRIDVANLKTGQAKLIQALNDKTKEITSLTYRVKKLEDERANLDKEETEVQGFFSKLKKKDKR